MFNENTNINVNVFKNNFKQNEKHPDYTQSFEVDGKFYKISMWEKKDKNGNSFFSTNISLDAYKNKNGKTTKEENVTEDNGDGDPFNYF